MSRASQIIIGIVSGLLGIMVFMVAMQSGGEGTPDPRILLLLSAIAICISIACFFTKSRPVTMRLIGVVLVVGGLTVFIKPPAPNADLKARRNPYAIYIFSAGLVAAGGWLAVTGKYPVWGMYGIQLKMIEEENAKSKTKKKVRKVKRTRPVDDEID